MYNIIEITVPVQTNADVGDAKLGTGLRTRGGCSGGGPCDLKPCICLCRSGVDVHKPYICKNKESKIKKK